ncbi:MAG TPA: hypothetical protein VL122_12350 [Nitrospirota bacterium]|nr:hypothetical protein [Nitrospirota bacterium]
MNSYPLFEQAVLFPLPCLIILKKDPHETAIFSNGPEKSGVELTIGDLETALALQALNRLSTNQTVTDQKPFDDPDYRPLGYSCAFGDANDSNCLPGQGIIK